MERSGQGRFGLSHGAVNWVSGLAGGTAQVIVGHPFDTVKVGWCGAGMGASRWAG